MEAREHGWLYGYLARHPQVGCCSALAFWLAAFAERKTMPGRRRAVSRCASLLLRVVAGGAEAGVCLLDENLGNR